MSSLDTATVQSPIGLLYHCLPRSASRHITNSPGTNISDIKTTAYLTAATRQCSRVVLVNSIPSTILIPCSAAMPVSHSPWLGWETSSLNISSLSKITSTGAVRAPL